MSSLYFHIPFCETKCIYCDFYSIENLDEKKVFVESLIKEIELQKQFHKEKIETIFLGGGTPSLLNSNELEKIFSAIQKYFHVEDNCEITIECNPGTVDKTKFNDYKKLKINRISFGVQSFFDDDLKFLSRIHSSKDAINSIKLAQDVGFDNINLDLIFSLPNQTQIKWEKNLLTAIKLNTNHISAYSLTYEKNTPIFKLLNDKQITPLSNEDDAILYERTIKLINDFGFNQYEVSNFAKKKFECKHNINYWTHKNYISFGPSAHSFWKDNLKRWWNVSNLKNYLKKISENELPISGSEVLNNDQFLMEKIMLGLRSGGIDILEINRIFKIDFFSKTNNLIYKLEKNNLATYKNNILKLTSSGFLVCDEIIKEFQKLF